MWAPVKVSPSQSLQFAVLFYILGVLHCQDHLFTHSLQLTQASIS